MAEGARDSAWFYSHALCLAFAGDSDLSEDLLVQLANGDAEFVPLDLQARDRAGVDFLV